MRLALSVLAVLSAATGALGALRQYYIAAEEAEWDYSNGMTTDPMMGLTYEEHPHAGVFMLPGEDRIGARYIKARYVEYTDSTFTTRRPIPDEEDHLALLGPTIRAEVGDEIRVLFRNRASFPISMHPHGVQYTKAHEGMMGPGQDDHMMMMDDAVAPGDSHEYEWSVPESAGPLPGQPSSIVWLYHDHADEVAGPYAGLVGTIIVTRKGWAHANGKPRDVDREMVLFFSVMNEGGSMLFDKNVQEYLNGTGELTAEHLEELLADGDFEESNLMHAINGRMYGSLEGLTMKQNEKVRWHLVALGTEVDLHSAHWHGNVVNYEGRRTDVIELLPASMHTADMIADNPGVWFTECHVADHVLGGMYMFYTVTPCTADCTHAEDMSSEEDEYATKSDVTGLAVALAIVGAIAVILAVYTVVTRRRAPTDAPAPKPFASGTSAV